MYGVEGVFDGSTGIHNFPTYIVTRSVDGEAGKIFLAQHRTIQLGWHCARHLSGNFQEVLFSQLKGVTRAPVGKEKTSKLQPLLMSCTVWSIPSVQEFAQRLISQGQEMC